MPYAIYLRKSRIDLEAEAHGEGDTLARHRKTLLALAAAQQLNVTRIYEEVVSGDTIAARPQMQQLLADVDEGLWEGVLVMEVERLARGDTIDQGIVAQAFKVTDTKIITPLKSYDPNNEFDEEYFEFGLFMARREYKVINRRLQRGRLASVKEGKWVGNTPPYGYRRVKLAQDKGFGLEPDPETAPVVRNIFMWYVEGRSDGTVIHPMGLQAICTKLNQSGIPSPSRQTWTASTVRDLLQNPVYCGLIRWGWRKQQKTYNKATGTFGIGAVMVVCVERLTDNPRAMRGTLCTVFLADNVIRTIMYAATGVLTAEVALTALKLLPMMILGLLGGMTLAGRLPDKTVRRIIIVMLMLTGASLALTNLL